MSRAPWILSAALLGSATLLACQAILGISDFAGEEPPPHDASSDTPDVNTADGSPLVDASGPAPICPLLPTTDAGPVPADAQAGLPYPTFAMRHVTFSDVTGYNLDCRDTQGLSDLPCVGSLPDDDGGIDRAYNNWVTSLIPGSDPVGTNVTGRMSIGVETMLLRVTSVPRTLPDNASAIQVAVSRSMGLTLVGCNSPQSVDAGDGSIVPAWDGCDSWRADTFTQNSSLSAYIANGMLVARFPTILLTFEGTTIPLYDSVLTAQVGSAPIADGGTVATLSSGTIAGRIRVADAIPAAARFELSGTPVCMTKYFATVADRLCTFRDLPSSGVGSATATCDSLSFAVGFDAVSALTYGSNFDMDASDPCVGIDIDASCAAR